MTERTEGKLQFANAEIERHRESGHHCEYLFAARSEEECELKKQKEVTSPMPVYPAREE